MPGTDTEFLSIQTIVMRKQRALYIFCAYFIMTLTLMLFPRHESNMHYEIALGKPWPYESLTATESFPVYKSQQQLEEDRQQILEEEFVPCFVRINDEPVDVVSVTDYEHLLSAGYTRISVVVNNKATTIPVSSLYTPRSAYEQMGLSCVPSLQEDTALSGRMRRNLIESVSLTEGMVQKGEKIIDRGEIVTDQKLQRIASLQRTFDEQTSLRQQFMAGCGEGLVVIVLMLLFALYLHMFRPQYIHSLRHVLFFCLLPALIIVLSCLEVRFTSLSIYLIPIAWVSILTRIFFDSRTAFFLHLVTVLIVSMVVSTPFEYILVQVTIGMVSIIMLHDLTRRAQIFQVSALIFVTYTVVFTSFRLATTGSLDTIVPSTYLVFAVNALLVVCSYALIYFFERAFHVMSALTLIELTDFSSELLRRFSDAAPGSFQHSLQVSALATEAAKAVGADELLVRTGAMYHDIGKLARPQYYTENQQDGQNPLLAMSPVEAARSVIAHVEEGVNLANQYHLPDSIVAFIKSHHGTGLVRYFYNTAVNRGDNPVESDFRYHGSKPRTKEQAILMMADAVEACSRSLTDLSEQSVTEMVNRMIDMQVSDGQFADAKITFRDMSTIKQIFVQHILVMNHHRVQYPTLNK